MPKVLRGAQEAFRRVVGEADHEERGDLDPAVVRERTASENGRLRFWCLLTEAQLSSSMDSSPTATAMQPDSAISRTSALSQNWSTVTMVTNCRPSCAAERAGRRRRPVREKIVVREQQERRRVELAQLVDLAFEDFQRLRAVRSQVARAHAEDAAASQPRVANSEAGVR